MPRTYTQDPEFLHAALIGLHQTLGGLDERIAELRGQLQGRSSSRKQAKVPVASSSPRRAMSAAARRRIGSAQKKRWAAYNAAKGKPAATKTAANRKAGSEPQKGGMSAEGRARVGAATKKRWAAFRKSQKVSNGAAKLAPAVESPAETPAVE
jgi:hypothetical protein